MTVEEQLQQLAAQNDALIQSDVKPDMGPVNAASNLPDEDTLALQRLQKRNDMLIAGKEESTGSAWWDYVAGINYKFENASEAILNGIQAVLTPGSVMSPDKERWGAIFKGALESIGVKAANIDTLANRIGQQNFTDLIMTAGMMAAAPAMVTTTSTAALPTLGRAIGGQMLKRPALATAEMLGAGAGQQVAQEAAPDNPLAEFGGAVAGGLGVSGTAAVGRKVAGVIPGLRTPKGVLPEPIRPANADPEEARVFAEQAVEGARTQMQKAMDDAVEAVPTLGNPSALQTAFRTSIEKAERIGNRIVSQFWELVPLKNPVPMSGIKSELTALNAELKDTPHTVPVDAKGQSFIDRLSALASPIRGANGRMQASLPTIQRLRDFRAEVREARLNMEASPVPNWSMVRNYNRLESIIDDGIQKAYPQDRTIDQARKVSIMYNDLFSRGPIADVMARRPRGDARVPPSETTEKLLREGPLGVQSAVNVRNKLAYQRAPGGGSFAVTPAERQQLQQLTTDAENSIRSMFREAAAQEGPEAAAKFVGKHEETIRALSKVHGELAMAEQQITAALRSQQNIQSSALAKYASSDPKYSFKRIFASGDPVATAKEVLLTLRRDPNALAGFQMSAVDDLLLRTKGDPISIRKLLGETKVENLYRTILGDASYNRLQRNTDIAYHLAMGDETFLKRHLIGRASILARIVGAQSGRILSHVLGGGTIQVPGILANSFARATERMLASANPRDLLTMSIIDPKWERLLLTREPKTILEGKKALKAMRRSLTAIEFTQQKAHDALANEQDQ